MDDLESKHQARMAKWSLNFAYFVIIVGSIALIAKCLVKLVRML